VADKYGLRKNIRFRTRVLSLAFDDAAKAWDVTVENVETGAREVLRADAVFNAFGPADR
jgi:4-hydroxyacetophenone monooxygenase